MKNLEKTRNNHGEKNQLFMKNFVFSRNDLFKKFGST